MDQPPRELPDLLTPHGRSRPLWVRVLCFAGAFVFFVLGLAGWLIPLVTGIPFYLVAIALLGRIDGKSPIEYVTEEREKNQVRDFARRYIATRVDRLDVIRDGWAQQVHA